MPKFRELLMPEALQANPTAEARRQARDLVDDEENNPPENELQAGFRSIWATLCPRKPGLGMPEFRARLATDFSRCPGPGPIRTVQQTAVYEDLVSWANPPWNLPRS